MDLQQSSVAAVYNQTFSPFASEQADDLIKWMHFYQKVPFKNLGFTIEKSHLIYGDLKIDLSGKEKLRDLFACFLKSKSGFLTTYEIVNNLYNPPGDLSSRNRQCLNHNVVKIISRARRMAKNQLAPHLRVKLDWFPYDTYDKSWSFYRIRGFKALH